MTLLQFCLLCKYIYYATLTVGKKITFSVNKFPPNVKFNLVCAH